MLGFGDNADNSVANTAYSLTKWAIMTNIGSNRAS